MNDIYAYAHYEYIMSISLLIVLAILNWFQDIRICSRVCLRRVYSHWFPDRYKSHFNFPLRFIQTQNCLRVECMVKHFVDAYRILFYITE